MRLDHVHVDLDKAQRVCMCLDLVAGVCVFVHAFIYVYMSVS